MDEKALRTKEVFIENELKEAYLAYAMSVIVGRALPDVRDGLKPVHRRIIYAMHDLGNVYNKAHKKSARIVGEVIGKYHPHGDSSVYDAMVRLAQEWNVRYTLVDGQGNFGCFTKDTKVKLTDGRNLSFEELVEEHKKGKINFTYTINKKGGIEIAEILNPRLTRKNAQLIKVTLDNKEEIRCTPDHKFMLRNGNYKRAVNLKTGESLMPLYTKLSDKEDSTLQIEGYEMVMQPNSSMWAFTHVLADNYNIQNAMYEINKQAFMPTIEFVEKEFNSVENALMQARYYNHKVLEVQELNYREDVYDLTINGTHNFALASGVFVHNSIDGDNPAAMRYTEARMSKITDKFLQDIEKNTVKFRNNFDDSLEEPEVLPAMVPSLLINGSSGIAVGMATNIPPHNLGEVLDSAIDLIDNPMQSVEELVRKKLVKGPDFPTGALMLKGPGLQDIYINGEGAVTMKAVCRIEEYKGGKEAIIVEEIPYQVNKLNLINQMVDLVKLGKIKDITDIRDESNKKGIRIVIEVKRDADPNIVLNQLFQFSSLKTNFNARLLAIVNGVPTILNLKTYLDNFIGFRKEVIIKRTKFDLKKSEDRLHILEGLVIALSNIDEVIKLIKASKSGPQAKEALIIRFKLSDLQAQAILDMRLQKLTGLEMDKIHDEHKAITELIKGLQAILDSDKRQYSIIKKEFEEMREMFGDERLTKIVNDDGNIAIEDLIKDEDFVVMVTQNDYIKKVPLEEYRSQRRGGKGVNANFKGEDTIKNLFVANSKDNVLIFTNDGNINWMKAYEIPTAKATMKGRPIVNYIDLRGKKITNIINVADLTQGHLIFLTRKGIIKKTEMANFSRPRAGGIKAINLDEGDTVLAVRYINDDSEIIIESNVGMAIRFKQDDLSVLGRTARGVKSIKLRDGEEVVGIELASPGKTLLTVTERGFGKRTLLSEYPTIKRAGRGVIDIKTDNRNGKVVTMNAVGEDDELFIMTKKKVVRTHVSDFRIIGRNTKGVRVVNLEDDDEILSVEKIIHDSEEDLETPTKPKKDNDDDKIEEKKEEPVKEKPKVEEKSEEITKDDEVVEGVDY